jgi:hypothetical protein
VAAANRSLKEGLRRSPSRGVDYVVERHTETRRTGPKAGPPRGVKTCHYATCRAETAMPCHVPLSRAEDLELSTCLPLAGATRSGLLVLSSFGAIEISEVRSDVKEKVTRMLAGESCVLKVSASTASVLGTYFLATGRDSAINVGVSDGQEWISTKEKANRLGLNRATVYRHARELGGQKIGSVWRFPAENVRPPEAERVAKPRRRRRSHKASSQPRPGRTLQIRGRRPSESV